MKVCLFLLSQEQKTEVAVVVVGSAPFVNKPPPPPTPGSHGGSNVGLKEVTVDLLYGAFIESAIQFDPRENQKVVV